MNALPLPLSFFVENLELEIPFSFARYGDGEWQCILGAEGQNCDGVEYSRALAEALTETLTRHADYYYAIGPKASRSQALGPRVEEWLSLYAPGLNWHDSEALLGASLDGTLLPFVQALSHRKVMLVGGEHLRALRVLTPSVHIQTPKKDAFAHIEWLEQEVLKRRERADVILFAAGPTAKLMIYHLQETLRKSHTLLDIGSLFDMYCGVDSRRYARRMDDTRKRGLLQQNFYGK